MGKAINSPLKKMIKLIDEQRLIDGHLKIIVYLITNTINGKKYIGQTRLLLWKRWLSHVSGKRVCVKMRNALNKYGQSAFTVSVLEASDSQDYINEKEKHWISHYRTTEDDFGYNITLGGLNYKMPFEKRAERSRYFVRCVETGEIFVSIVDAAKSKSVSCGNVYQCVEKRPSFNTAGGYHWEKVNKQDVHLDDLVKEVKIIPALPKHSTVERKKYRSVVCVDTQKSWFNVETLARFLGLNKYSYLRKCMRQEKPFRGFVYAYSH